MHSSSHRSILTHSIAFLLASSGSGFAIDNLWTGNVDTNWNEPANWSLGRVPVNPSPDVFDDAAVNTLNNFPVIIADTVAKPRDTKVGVGVGTNGRADHRAGVHSTSGWTYVGTTGGTGVYNLANTATTGPGISGYAEGAGTLNFGGRLYVGEGVGGNGVFNINTSGTLTNNEQINDRGVYIGAGGGTGVVNLQSGTVNDWETRVGVDAGSNGTLNISGGRWDTNHWTVIGENRDSTGTVNMTGGTWNNNHTDWLSIGQRGNGTFNMSGGVLNDQAVVDTSVRTTNKGNVVVGRWETADTGTGGQGVWNLSGTALARVRSLLVGDQINTNGRVNISENAQLVSEDFDLFLANNGTGRVDVNGGTASFNKGWVYMGQGAAGNGTLNVNGGSISSNRYYVGQNGTGAINVNGGTLTANDFILAGESATGVGSFNVSNGVANTRAITLGNAGLGTSTITGGQVNASGTVTIGNGANVGNRMDVSGAADVNVFGQLWVANNPGANGQLNISAGTVSSDNWIAVGRNGGTGVVNLSGTGSLEKVGTNTTHFIVAGTSGAETAPSTGTLNQTGGTLTTTGTGEVRLGEGAGSQGTWNMSGGVASTDGVVVGWTTGGSGTLKVSSTAVLNAGFVAIGSGGVGVVEQTGGTINVTGNFDIQASAANAGSYSMSGGTLSVDGIISTDNGAFAWTGGTITRADDLSPITFSDNLKTGAGAATLGLDGGKTFQVGGTFDKTAGITLELTGRTIPAYDGSGIDTGSFTLGTTFGIVGAFDPAVDKVLGLGNPSNATFISEIQGEGGLFNPNSQSVFWVQESGGQVTLNYSLVPEPGTVGLLACAGMILGLRRRRK